MGNTKTKTFKIGEYAIGGIVKVEIKKNAQIIIKCLDWDSKKVVLKKEFSFVDKSKLSLWLECEVTTPYYTYKIINYLYA